MIEELQAFFNPARIASISFWGFSVWMFYKSAIARKNSIWEGLKGDDNKLQVHEIAAFFWVLLFPEVVFLQLLIIVTNLEVDQKHLDLFTWIEGSLTLLAGAVILRKNDKPTINKDNNKTN